jgi:hypothetical protein
MPSGPEKSEAAFLYLFLWLTAEIELSWRPIETRQTPGQRFAFGGILWGNRLTPAGDTPMRLKDLEVRHAAPRDDLAGSC